MAPDKFPPYDEDVIVKQLTRIFQIFTDLCYARDSDVIFPSISTSPNDPPRHNFSQTTRKLFSDLNFSDQVISLLERTPYIREDPSREYPIYTADTVLYPITKDDYVRPAREIVDVSVEEPRRLGADEIALAVPKNREGMTMILDVGESLSTLDQVIAIRAQIHVVLYLFETDNLPNHVQHLSLQSSISPTSFLSP